MRITPFPSLVRALLRIAVLLCGPVLPLFAAEALTLRFDLPAGEARPMLRQFAAQAKREIVFPTESVDGVKTNAVRGEMTPLEAVDRMLAGTGLTAAADPKTGAFAVRKGAADPNASRAAPGAASRPPGNPAEFDPVRGASSTVTGYVTNIASGGVLNRASIVVEGTAQRTVTTRDGKYSLTLSPGHYTIAASYAGLDVAKATVDLEKGQTLVLNFNLTSDIYKLDPFVVTTIREQDAIALQQQRYSEGLKTVAATTSFGAPADNPGEILQRLPGISANYAQGEVDNISIRGMGQSFGKLTIDGQTVATTRGNLLATGREFMMTELSTNNLSQVELVKAPTPDQDADAIAGTVNLVTKRHFDQPGKALIVNTTLSGLSRDVDSSPVHDKLGHYGRASISYTDSFGILGGSKNLGVAVDAAWSRVLRVADYTGPYNAGNLQVSYVNPDGANPLGRLFSASEWGGAIKKINGNVGIDYKLGTSGFLFAKLSYTEQHRDNSRWMMMTANTPTTATGFTPESTYQNATISAPTAQLITRMNRNYRVGYNYVLHLGGEYDLARNTRLSANAQYSRSQSRDPGFCSFYATLDNIAFRLDRRNRDEFEPLFVQTGGAAWTDPANWKINRIDRTKTIGAPTDNYLARADLTQKLDTKYPAGIKLGLKYYGNTIADRRTYETWTYKGRDGVPNSADDILTPLAAFTGITYGNSGYGPFPFGPMLSSTEEMLNGSQAGNWAKTAAQAYSDLTGAFARQADFDERMGAGYIQANIRIGSVRGLAGFRYEKTDTIAYSWIRNVSVAAGTTSVGGASLDPAVVAANVARAERSYVTRQRTSSSYGNVFPGVHFVWEPAGGLLVRTSYNRSISRPPLSAMLPTGSVNEDLQTVTIGNPDLKPYTADNFELSVERYFEPVGLLSAGVFKKDLSNYFRSFSDVIGPEGIDGSGRYAGYTRTTSRNIGSARIDGVELSFQQQFRKLPGFLKGLGAFANFTYLRTEGDFGTLTVSRRLPNMVPKTLNAGVSYVGHGWQIRPMLNWQDRTYRGTSGIDYDSLARTWVDLKVQYSISRRYSVELNASNLTNEAESNWVSSARRLPFAQIRPGTAYSVGITGRF